MNAILKFIERDWLRTKLRHTARVKFWRDYKRYRAANFTRSQARFMASLVL